MSKLTLNVNNPLKSRRAKLVLEIFFKPGKTPREREATSIKFVQHSRDHDLQKSISTFFVHSVFVSHELLQSYVTHPRHVEDTIAYFYLHSEHVFKYEL